MPENRTEFNYKTLVRNNAEFKAKACVGYLPERISEGKRSADII